MDDHFLKIAEKLHFPRTGTKHMAPLLYTLVRSTRAKHVLEYGAGYTTLFILKALFENAQDFANEATLLREKTKKLFSLKDPDRRAWEDWFFSSDESCFVDPRFFLQNFQPRLFSFDQEPIGNPWVANVFNAAEQLKLRDLLSIFHGDPNTQMNLVEQYAPFDLIWNDAKDYSVFFKVYWPLLDPKGGLMVFHNTINSWQSTSRELDAIRSSLSPSEYEFMSIVEPHKHNQRSCSIFRKISHFNNAEYIEDPETIQKVQLAAKDFLDRPPG